MHVEDFPHADLTKPLANEIFTTRRSQFVDRLGWDLCVDGLGQEQDSYDDRHAHYVTVSRADQLLLSCRLRPATQGTMIEDVFSQVFRRADGFLEAQRDKLWELTRFCRSPDISIAQSGVALRAMSHKMDDVRDRWGATGFVAVVYPHCARYLARMGARFLLIDEGRIDDKACFLICITHAVDHRATRPTCRVTPVRSPVALDLAA